MKFLSIAFFFVTLTAFAQDKPHHQIEAKGTVNHEANLCSVIRRPQTYMHKTVEIRADILLALPHGALLIDKSCPGRGIPLGVDLLKADVSAKNLVPSILSDCSDTPHPKTIAGIFIGKLSYSAEGRLNLRLLSIHDLDVKPCIPPNPSSMGDFPSAAFPLKLPN